MMPDAVERLWERDDVLTRETRIELSPDHWADPEAVTVGADGHEVAGHYAGVAVRNDDGDLLFVRHGAGDDREWALPGGNVEDGEDQRAAAAREVREETGVDPEIERPLSVTRQVFVHATADRTAVGHFVLYAGHATDATVGDDLGIETADEDIAEATWRADVPEDTFLRDEVVADLDHWGALSLSGRESENGPRATDVNE